MTERSNGHGSSRSAGPQHSTQRLERKANERRARARAHLAQARRRRTPRQSGHERPHYRWARLKRAGVFAASAVLGTLLAGTARETIVRLWAPEEVQAIAVQGHERLTPTQVASATGIELGSAFAQVDANKVEVRLRAHPWITSASALRVPSGRLLLDIDERQPRAVLQCAGSKQHHLVDGSGIPFAPAEAADAGLPRLRSARKLRAGEPHGLLVEAVQLSDGLSSRGFEGPFELSLPEEGDAEGWRLRLAHSQHMVVLGREELDSRLDHLAALINSGVLAERADATRIDLRFPRRAILEAENRGVREGPASS